MRYPASEKLEIIRLVEQSQLPAKQTLDRLGDPEMIQRYIEKRNDELEKLNSTQSSQIKSLADRKQAIAAKIERVTELLIGGTLDKLTGGPKIRSLRKESNDIDDEIEKLELTAPVKCFSDDAVSTYLESLGNLEGALRGPDDITTSENFAAVRDLIDQIIVHPTASKVPDVEIIGDLCPLLDKHTRAISAGGLLVAEERCHQCSATTKFIC